MTANNSLRQVGTYQETDTHFEITVTGGEPMQFDKKKFATFQHITDKWWSDFAFEDGSVYAKDPTIQITPNGLKYRATSDMNLEWNAYNISVAECHLANYGKIYIDTEYSEPIDNEYDLESIYESINRKKS